MLPATIRAVSVVPVTPQLTEKPSELRDQIRDCLRTGSHVVVLCDTPNCRRAARLALATARSQGEFPNCRLAIVTPNVSAFVDSLPNTVVQHLTMFESEDQAIDWLGLGGPLDSDRTTLVWPMAV